MEALGLTHRKLAAERWTHSHLEGFAGPQSFPQLLGDRARLLANGFSLVTPEAPIGRSRPLSFGHVVAGAPV